MILSVTPNPSVDATITLHETINPGTVHRADRAFQVAGGKGVNVTHAMSLAGTESLALLPSAHGDYFLSLMDIASIPYEAVPMTDPVRINTTLTEPDGRTTKLNGPGPTLSPDAQAALAHRITELAPQASWIVFAGSLPVGVPAEWYCLLVRELRTAAPHTKIAVDTSDAPMVALGENLATAAPDLIKPNGFELGQLTGRDGYALEEEAARGDYSNVVEAAREVAQRGVNEVLVTLGGAGAALVTADEAWIATPPPTAVVSTVGAGDSALAGYIMARSTGSACGEALRNAVAYGSAAAALPGTQLPTPEQIHTEATRVRQM
ncbi:1-phosphofructokinase family hexose kinase [Corynebacterium sp.]|uniref:1-phosphofructokinase family hexose kinase n=1 Tax=Corynebacterium sp. TaxID=1720 RepID=UPI0026DC4D7D|nr:1-phosphofructokinase family hexose kinase [Corynebacterium sp.]MDO5031690.1 1-phosphofructokinase family hexose kinase [Corynebacterium sp.]